MMKVSEINNNAARDDGDDDGRMNVSPNDFEGFVRGNLAHSTQKSSERPESTSSPFDSEEKKNAFIAFFSQFSPERRLQSFLKETSEIRNSPQYIQGGSKPSSQKSQNKFERNEFLGFGSQDKNDARSTAKNTTDFEVVSNKLDEIAEQPSKKSRRVFKIWDTPQPKSPTKLKTNERTKNTQKSKTLGTSELKSSLLDSEEMQNALVGFEFIKKEFVGFNSQDKKYARSTEKSTKRKQHQLRNEIKRLHTDLKVVRNKLNGRATQSRKKSTNPRNRPQAKNPAELKTNKRTENARKPKTNHENILELSTQTSSLFDSEEMERSYLEYLRKYQRAPTPMPENLPRREKMRWLREKRNVGLWVTCDKCNKSRYLEDTKDPLELPDKWYCPMNPDQTKNDCSYAEDKIPLFQEIELIRNKYHAGSIVYAKVKGYPWWPGMVQDNPEYLTYFILKEFSDTPAYYHVLFFGEISTAWVHVAKLKGFKRYCGNEKLDGSKSMRKYRKRVMAAEEQARAALTLTLSERLERYSIE